MKKNLAIVLVLCGCIIFTAGGCSKSSSNDEASSAKADSTANTESTAKPAKSNAAAKAEGGKMEINIGSVSGEPGTTVTVPVDINTLPKKGVGSCNFNIKYDSKILEAVEANTGSTIANAANIDYSIIDAKGMINFLYTSNSDGKNAIEKTGNFINITFKIKKAAKSGSTVVDSGNAGTFGDTDLNKINAVFSSGKVTVK